MLLIIFASQLLLVIFADYEGRPDDTRSLQQGVRTNLSANTEIPPRVYYTHHSTHYLINNHKNPQRGPHRVPVAVFDEAFANVTSRLAVFDEAFANVTSRVAVFDEAFDNVTRSQNSSFFYFDASRAQDNEDVWLFENLFFGMKNGIIIESGALDGLKFSTSFIYENLFGYEAIHIEADPQNFQNLIINRPNSTNIHAGLCGDSIRALHYASSYSKAPVLGFLEFMG